MPTDAFVSTDGVRLFTRTVGEGPRVVLIPNGIHLEEDFSSLACGRTLVFYDVRNRGRSDAIGDGSRLEDGVLNDVEDIDAVRRHIGADHVDLIGHSYLGLTVVLYALQYPQHARRVVQIGPIQPDQSTQYPPELTNHDDVYRAVMTAVGALQRERGAHDPIAFCRMFWDVLRPLYVTDPANAGRVQWQRCDLPNERAFMTYWMRHLYPSMQRLRITRESLAGVDAPVLTVHGTKDRSSPFGAGREWASLLPHGRLLAVDGAGHAPWIEDPVAVFGAIDDFLH